MFIFYFILFYFIFLCGTKDTTNKNKTMTTGNTTNDTLLILLTVQYFLRIQFLHYFYSLFVWFFFCNHTPMYLASYIMLNKFPLSLKHITIIVLGSDVAFMINFVFSLN